MAITNPPTKRKKLTGLGYLYIDDADSWTVNGTPIFKWDSSTCFTAPADEEYHMDDSTTIVVVGGKISA